VPRKKTTKKTSRRKKQKKFELSPLLVVAILLGSILLVYLFSQAIQAYHSDGVLGVKYLAKGGDDDNSGSGSSGSGSGSEDSNDSNSDDSDNDNSGSSGSDSDDNNSGSSNINTNSGSTGSSDTIKTESTTPDGVRIRTETRDDGETRTEVKISETERIRTRTKDGLERIDVTSDGVKVRLETRDDRFVVKAEKEDGTEVELDDDQNTLLKIEDRLGRDNIKISTASAGRILLQRGSAGAVTEFPLSVDLATNELVINTPSGQRNVTVLPDVAIRNLLAANVISRLNTNKVIDLAQTGSDTILDDVIQLGVNDGIPVYTISGLSEQKLLGFIPVIFEKDVTVSAENGEVIDEQIPLQDRILDIISF